MLKMINAIVLNNYRGVEQWLARWAHNPKVRGSNPLPAIFQKEITLIKIL